MKCLIGSVAALVAVATACSSGSAPSTAPTRTVPTTPSPGFRFSSAGDAEVMACGQLSLFKADEAHNAGAGAVTLDVSTLYGDAVSARNLAPTDATMKRLFSAARALAEVVEFDPAAAEGSAAARALANLHHICPSS